MRVLASVSKTVRTLWITDRSATMEATPTAMQTKKNTSRRHEARVSRIAMRITNIMRGNRSAGGSAGAAPIPTCSTTRPSRRTRRASASAASSTSCVTSTMVVPRARWVSRSSSRMFRPVVLSRLPVGSSARTIGGSLASARASRDPALLLAAGELGRWVVMGAAGQADFPEQRRRATPHVGGAGNLHRHGDVFIRRQRSNQSGRTETRSRSSSPPQPRQLGPRPGA